MLLFDTLILFFLTPFCFSRVWPSPFWQVSGRICSSHFKMLKTDVFHWDEKVECSLTQEVCITTDGGHDNDYDEEKWWERKIDRKKHKGESRQSNSVSQADWRQVPGSTCLFSLFLYHFSSLPFSSSPYLPSIIVRWPYYSFHSDHVGSCLDRDVLGWAFREGSSKSYSYRMLKIQSSRTREGREHPRRPLTTRWSGRRHFPDVSEWKTLGRVRPVVRTEILEKRKAMKCSMNKDDCQWGERDGGDNFLFSIYRRGFFFSYLLSWQ